MSARTPVIGITTYGPDDDFEPARVSLPVAYVDAVRRAGGAALLLPTCESAPDALLERIDGLILSGGGDIDPEQHAGGTHPDVYMVTPERDRFELALARRVLESARLPVLGICRGMQIMNVALGGDLELHLPDVRGESVAHRAPPREPVLHPVEVEPGSVLEHIYGRTSFPVCSWHHQEVRRLGRGLRAIASAADGVIEAVVLEGGGFALGVQWHPEMQVEDDPLQLRIFEALVERAGGR